MINCHGSHGGGACDEDNLVSYIQEDIMPSWMSDLLQQTDWTKGKVACPSCKARIGSFNFVSGRKCACQRWVLPAIRLVNSKMDLPE